MTGDLINGLFELATAGAIARNIFAIRRDKEVKGARASNTIFFLAWGLWNIWFYPHNGLYWSWLGGLAVVAANSAWLAMVISYLPIGTRSMLYGVHAFWLHPFLIALGWWRLYGFPWDPRLWVAFFVHDLGYWNKPNMDGPEGETHPELGAALMRRWFGDAWGDLCLYHSRYYAKRAGHDVSPLCHADKMVFLIEPAWLYLPRVQLTGELAEFMATGAAAAKTSEPHLAAETADLLSGDGWRWHRAVRSYMKRWLAEHKDGAPDTWSRVRHVSV